MTFFPDTNPLEKTTPFKNSWNCWRLSLLFILSQAGRRRGSYLDQRECWRHCPEAFPQHQPRHRAAPPHPLQQLALQGLHPGGPGRTPRLRQGQTQGTQLLGCQWIRLDWLSNWYLFGFFSDLLKNNNISSIVQASVTVNSQKFGTLK